MRRSRSPGQRAGLTRAQILAAARDLLAERGVHALTMRRVAARLGVAPNALYSHVDGKDALVDELLDDALAAVNTPAPERIDPVAGMHDVITSTYHVLVAHADLIPLYLSRQGARGDNAQRLGTIMLGLLARTGITGPRARDALHVLIVHAIGSAAFSTSSQVSSEAGAVDAAERFDQGLRWLLSGITSAPARPPA
jgi:AcrR family transcriptional regulator